MSNDPYDTAPIPTSGSPDQGPDPSPDQGPDVSTDQGTDQGTAVTAEPHTQRLDEETTQRIDEPVGDQHLSEPDRDTERGFGFTETDDTPPRRTHPLSVTYLVAGLVFLGIATSWALRQIDVIDAQGVQWVMPLTLVVAGTVGLVAWLGKSARNP